MRVPRNAADGRRSSFSALCQRVADNGNTVPAPAVEAHPCAFCLVLHQVVNRIRRKAAVDDTQNLRHTKRFVMQGFCARIQLCITFVSATSPVSVTHLEA
jgi:hypothetical protein